MGKFLDHLRSEEPQLRSRQWVLGQPAEERLDRLCYALAWFERVYRDGVISAESPLGTSSGALDAEGLLAQVPEYAVDDLQVQIRLAERALGQLRELTPEAGCRAGPTFVGGADVGGADADLLVGRSLLEFKSTSRPGYLTDKAILQLAGYVVLDYKDEFAINEVGFYMSRIGWLVTWPVTEFIRLLGCRDPLPRLRAQFAAAAESLGASRTTSR